jgi:hypothetical protein
VPERSQGKASLTEAFLHWVHENPEEVAAMQAAEAETDLARELRRKAREDKAHGRRRLAAEVPF